MLYSLLIVILILLSGGPYANFAGRDASRGLAKNSFDLDMLTDPNEAIDKLEDLNADEWESLREWEVKEREVKDEPY